MTEPHQTILRLLTTAATPLSGTSVVVRASEHGYTQDSVRDALDALVKAGKLRRDRGYISIVEA